MTRRKVHRSDANQKAVIEILRRAGAEVHVIGRPVDLLVWWGKWLPVEVKNPEGRNRLTPYQEQFLETTRGPVAIVDSPEGAISIVRGMIKSGLGFSMKCKNCNIEMVEGVALRERWAKGVPDWPGQTDDRTQTYHPSGESDMVNVLKCPVCGYSVSLSASNVV